MKERILIVESSGIIAEGLKSIIEAGIPDSSVCVAGRRCVVADEALRTGANVVIVNPFDRMCSGSLQTKKIRDANPNLRILAVVRQYTENSVLSGYDAVIDVNDSREKIVDAVRKAKPRASVAKPDDTELSEREKSVLVLVTEGLMSKEIADRLNISIHTVNSHRKNISRKTGIKSVAGLTLYAMLNGLRD